MVAMEKTAWFALMNWKTRTRSPRSPVRTRLPPLPRCRAPGAVAGSHAADASVPRAQRWSGRPVGGFHRDRPDEPSSRSPGRSARTHATAPPGFAHIGPDQPSVAGIPADRVGDSSASMAPPSQVERCPPNRVNSSKAVAQGLAWAQCPPGYAPNVPHHSIKTQVLSASLPEFSKEIGPAPVEVVHHLVQGAIGRKVGLTDNVQCPLGSRDHRSGRYEPYPPGQGIDLD